MDLGQLFVIGFSGHSVPAEAARLFRDQRAGGAILFSRNIVDLEQVVELNAELVGLGATDTPMLISVDQEGGRVARLRGICTDLPPMRAVGDACEDDPDLPYRIGAMMARELSALGFHLDYTPVVDVDTNPNNPVIGERSLGRDPQRVAQAGAQLIRGMQQGGVAASAKHFPGHGDTDTDSHLALPRVPHAMKRLEQVELVPFRAAVDVGVATIMTAHVMLPAIDPEMPATLSKPLLTDLLRHRMGYAGVIVSDDLEMAAVAAHFSIEELVEHGLHAGVDLFLICHDAEKQARAIEAVHRLVQDGVVSEARIQSSLTRIRALKERFVGAPAPPSVHEARTIVRSEPHLGLVERFRETEVRSDRPSSMVDEV